jgi:hypothetical protein
MADDAERERTPAEFREPVAEDLRRVPDRVEQLVPLPPHGIEIELA